MFTRLNSCYTNAQEAEITHPCQENLDTREEILDLITSMSRSARESELRPRIAKHLCGRVRPSRSLPRLAYPAVENVLPDMTAPEHLAVEDIFPDVTITRSSSRRVRPLQFVPMTALACLFVLITIQARRSHTQQRPNYRRKSSPIFRLLLAGFFLCIL